jgi:hypothetical protein
MVHGSFQRQLQRLILERCARSFVESCGGWLQDRCSWKEGVVRFDYWETAK